MAATRFLRDARSGADICLCLWACICVCLWAPLGRVCSAPALRFYAAERMAPPTAHGWVADAAPVIFQALVKRVV
jgi:hypothetical protein